jgi:hypothetical protein
MEDGNLDGREDSQTIQAHQGCQIGIQDLPSFNFHRHSAKFPLRACAKGNLCGIPFVLFQLKPNGIPDKIAFLQAKKRFFRNDGNFEGW